MVAALGCSGSRKISGPDVEARRPGDGELQPLGDAPGEYVKVRSNAA